MLIFKVRRPMKSGIRKNAAKVFRHKGVVALAAGRLGLRISSPPADAREHACALRRRQPLVSGQ